MSKKTLFFGVTVLALAGGAVLVHSQSPTLIPGYWATFVKSYWPAERAAARQPNNRANANRPVPVEVAKAERKQVPIKLDALGTVTPIASVALKTRVDTTITEVHFKDGARVEKGDLLFTLDCRQIEADMDRIQAVIDGAEATLAEAKRDVERYTELAARNATPIVTLNKARTLVNVTTATAKSNRAQLENLQVQLGFCSIKAPISGRISMANVKVGNFVRQADSMPMATIIQTAPVYVSFTVPQKNLPAIREALAAKTARIQAFIPGAKTPEDGQVSMIENTIEAATGMATIRATMPNPDEGLWPGTLVSVDVTLRTEDAVVVPSNAVQVSQEGSLVFVVDNNVAKVRRVTVARQAGEYSVIGAGLKPGETVVIEGQLRLRNGARVTTRGRNGGGERKPRPAGS
jgi:RND family efflux transporter MFP subunit